MGKKKKTHKGTIGGCFGTLQARRMNDTQVGFFYVIIGRKQRHCACGGPQATDKAVDRLGLKREELRYVRREVTKATTL